MNGESSYNPYVGNDTENYGDYSTKDFSNNPVDQATEIDSSRGTVKVSLVNKDGDGRDKNFAKLKHPRVTENFEVAHVLLRYGFSKPLISIVSTVNVKNISFLEELCRKNNEAFNLENGLLLNNINTANADKRILRLTSPRNAVKDKTVGMAYTILMSLYIRFHSGDPSESVDLQALMLAWNQFIGILRANKFRKLPDVDISDFWYLCSSMHIDYVRDADTDGGYIQYNKDLQTFYFTSTFSRKEGSLHHIATLKSLKEIEQSLSKKSQANQEV